MLKLLEVSWLMIMLGAVCVSAFQFVTDCWQSAVWMLFVTAVAGVMYTIRRKQRLRLEQEQKESSRYH